MAHRGTEPDRELIKDLSGGFLQLAGVSPQFNKALDYYKEFRSKYPNAKVIHVGHSLGGSIAQAFAVWSRRMSGQNYKDTAITFNSAGAWHVIDGWDVNADDFYPYIDNYIAVKDFVPILMPQVGRKFYVEAHLDDATANPEKKIEKIEVTSSQHKTTVNNVNKMFSLDYHMLHNFNAKHFKYAENLDRYDRIVPMFWWYQKVLLKNKTLGVIDVDYNELD